MNRKIIALSAVVFLGIQWMMALDTVPSGFSRPLEWRGGGELNSGWVPGSNRFLRGENPDGKRIDATAGFDLRADFSFSASTREGMLYKGLRQGIGLGINSYFTNSLLGTPVSLYIYQGGPVARLSRHLRLGYEWQFGAAFGWKHYDAETAENNAVASTSVTAHMGIGVKLYYELSRRWELSAGIVARHYSNGNTSWPNAGLNSVGGSLGISYIFNPLPGDGATDPLIAEEADRGRWFYDIMAFGAWRKRVVSIGNPPVPQLCPGKFGIVGFQFAPSRRLNRWVAVGPAIDAQWDESGGITPYWVEGTADEFLKFYRPPFGKQLSVGVSAHAELTTPIFSLNAGIGYDIVNPKGDKRFYQSLTLKTFITKHIYLNTGYRLGRFSDPQNLMLGVGLRL